MAIVLSVNIGAARETAHSDVGVTGIDKRPVAGPVFVRPPEVGSALEGDVICDHRFHGGADKAVYAYAREDLDLWSAALGRELTDGVFGENLTTRHLDVSHALIGETWRVGPSALLRITEPRVPCRTFAGWLGEQGWVKRFTGAASPGAYMAVLEAGPVRAGDRIEVVERPDHGVSVRVAFKAMTTESGLLSRLLEVDNLREYALRRLRSPEPDDADKEDPGAGAADEAGEDDAGAAA
ncbi:MAG TPA: MOSC domain-containing protein [Actinocrinis sp.]|jgi:MOSC domain-containing protein YiiM|nr:MOSC domain-containing protein [Actinocrinis sp.]HEV3172574.1 MOSC domain-containing protein [Actinocrinis sp.]